MSNKPFIIFIFNCCLKHKDIKFELLLQKLVIIDKLQSFVKSIKHQNIILENKFLCLY